MTRDASFAQQPTTMWGIALIDGPDASNLGHRSKEVYVSIAPTSERRQLPARRGTRGGQLS